MSMCQVSSVALTEGIEILIFQGTTLGQQNGDSQHAVWVCRMEKAYTYPLSPEVGTRSVELVRPL